MPPTVVHLRTPTLIYLYLNTWIKKSHSTHPLLDLYPYLLAFIPCVMFGILN